VSKARFTDVQNFPMLPRGHTKKVLHDGDNFHVWIHGDEPRTKGPMHKHTADQTFYCVQGECTFHFADGPDQKLTPGCVVVIPKGQFYQLDNTGTEYMILLGSRAEKAGNPRFGAKNEVVTEGGKIQENAK
jgi:quercetin dioxygenase-like cupin family protein